MVDRIQKRIKQNTSRYSDGSDNLFIRHNMAISVYHVPSDSEVAFKAMLTELSEAYEPEWAEEKVYGRSDPMGTFQGTERVINLAWQTAAGSEKEAYDNAGSISLLISMLYPTYEVRDFDLNSNSGLDGANTSRFSSATISSAPLVRLKFMNLIANSQLTDASHFTAKRDGQLGMIKGLTVTPDLDAGFIHGTPGGLIPKVYSITMPFKVIHEHPVGWGSSNGAVRFLTADAETGRGHYPYGFVHFERDSEKFENEQQVNKFRDVRAYTRTRGPIPVQYQGQGVKVENNRRVGPENSQAAKLKKNGLKQ